MSFLCRQILQTRKRATTTTTTTATSSHSYANVWSSIVPGANLQDELSSILSGSSWCSRKYSTLDDRRSPQFALTNNHHANSMRRPLSFTTESARYFSSTDSKDDDKNKEINVGIDIDPSIQECVDHHDAEQAEQMLQQRKQLQSLLDNNEAEQQSSSSTATLDVDTYTAVLDAWISHQQDVLEVMDSPQALVAELYKAADHANGVLDIMLEESMKKTDNDLVRPTSHHYDAVLKAWWNVCEYNDKYKMTKVNAPASNNGIKMKDFTKGVPQRAQRVLDQMEYQSNEIHDLQPSIESYNWVMDIWSKSNEHLKATMAQSIYGRLGTSGISASGGRKVQPKTNTIQNTSSTSNSLSASDKWGIEPDSATHRIMIQAWCTSPDEKGAAFHATGHLMRLQDGFAKQDVEEMEPTMKDYHSVLKAWSHAKKNKTAYKKAMNILKSMDKLYMDRFTELRPDETCFKYVLQTLANAPPPSPSSYSSSSATSSSNDIGELVDQILDQMEERLFVPDTECYGAAIRAWRNHAVLDTKRARPQEDAARANALLKSMERAYHRTSTSLIKPTTDHYNDVIQAWSVCKFASLTVTAGELAEKLLMVLEQGGDIDEVDEDETISAGLKPNTNSYVWTLNAYANSDMEDKVDRAMAVFDRLKKRAAASDSAAAVAATVGNDSTLSDVNAIQVTTNAANAMMKVCASATTGTDEEKKARLRTVLAIMADLERTKTTSKISSDDKVAKEGKVVSSLGGPPNCKSFRILLEACANLLPSGGVERSRALEMAFKKCCNAGLVDVDVLQLFEEKAPRDLYHTMVIAEGIEEEGTGTKMVPPEWTRHLSHRVLTIDGRRPPPLSIEGRYVMTPALYENRMRKLRKRVNQRLIRGGRLRIPKRKKRFRGGGGSDLTNKERISDGSLSMNNRADGVSSTNSTTAKDASITTDA